MRFASTAFTALLLVARSQSSAFGVVGKSSRRSLASIAATTTSKRQITSFLKNNKHSVCPAAALPFFRGGALSPAFSTQLRTSTTTAEPETAAPAEVFRKDYTPLPFTVQEANLDIIINPGETTVHTEMKLIPNPASVDKSSSLLLDGEQQAVTLREISMDGKTLQEGTDYKLTPTYLEVYNIPSQGAVLKTTVTTVPEDNTQLSGLYKSGSMYCSQMEALGFRRMTYYPDRPDNMAVFKSVRIEADKKENPVLLSNGNLIQEGDVNDSRHFAIWSDPFPKPCYLFAVVAGDLGKIEDTYTTMSGRKVQLQVFSEHNNVEKLEYAMESLKRSMKWDEDRFGLEYDLDLYNIVAVESFNMGAMENKGLNIFNTAYVLADREQSTDTDFERVEGVIGHEYFHNWTGNRVTCRDWFQLTLKEGLTVFRDQEFSGDLNSKAVNRIENVRGLRARQFNEDAGPMAHPVRPESYISMDNFYTATVYSKGSEVIRMYQTILGVEGFKKGMKLYFERHDGSAVTCDDFLAAMADANDVDLGQFSLWYSTPGTPSVTYTTEYNDGVVSITFTQTSNSAKPLHIPIAVGLLDKKTGKEVMETQILNLQQETQTFNFSDLDGDVVPSLLRSFSAPIKLTPESGEVDEESLAFLAERDTDGFNRWEAGQQLYTALLFQTLKGEKSEKTLQYVYESFKMSLMDKETTDYSIQAYDLMLPTESTLAEEMEVVDPIGLHKARGAVKQALAREFEEEIRTRYEELTAAMDGQEFKVDAESIGRRRLRNVLLDYLCSIRESKEEQIAAAKLATAHFAKATGMTDKMAALSALSSMDGEGASARDIALQKFYDDADGDFLVLNKWFTVQALADLPDVLQRVKKLAEHPEFTLLNPNRCRSLISAFAMNSAAFHDESGAGYEFIGDILVELDQLNPQISSRMAGSLIQWRRFDEKRGQLMKAQLERLASLKLSDDLYEIVSRGLK